MQCEGLRTRSAGAEGEDGCSIQVELSDLSFFHSLLSLCPRWIERYALIPASVTFLLSLLPRMIISFRNSLLDTLRNNVLQAIWASLNPVKFTHKIGLLNRLRQKSCIFMVVRLHVTRHAPSWRSSSRNKIPTYHTGLIKCNVPSMKDSLRRD